jgi:hypothetical protein
MGDGGSRKFGLQELPETKNGDLPAFSIHLHFYFIPMHSWKSG